MEMTTIIDEIKKTPTLEGQLKTKFGLLINPFPKSGIANLSDPERVTAALAPIHHDTLQKVINYMKDAIAGGGSGKDKYVSLIVRGEYGSGKTQLLMYLKYLFSQLTSEEFHPFVVYLDNPGLSISELIGNVISQIGVENFRRYLWDTFISYLNDGDSVSDGEQTRKERFESEINAIIRDDSGLFPNNQTFNFDDTLLSYKALMDKIISLSRKAIQKQIGEVLKRYMCECLIEKFQHATVVDYFYNIVSENVNMLKSWGAIIDGGIKNMDNRSVNILNAIVEIVKKYINCTDFIILVDEFEEIATGRLKDSDLDIYLRNLRTLIDREREWCSVFAMTGIAYEKVRSVSPPLASRIGDRIVDLKPFNYEDFKKVVTEYLNLAREKTSDSIFPFTEEALKRMMEPKNSLYKGSPRFLLKNCYMLLQRAAEKLEKSQAIEKKFVDEYMADDLQ